MQSNEAEEHLRVIRSLMEKATIYRAISAPTALIAGLLAIGAAYLGYRVELKSLEFPTENSSLSDYAFPLIWLCMLALVGAANGWFLFQDARRRGDKFISNGMKMALISLIPSHLTAAVLSVVFQAYPSVLALIWIVFHGIGLLATGHFSPRSMTLLGWGFLLAGLGTIVAHTVAPSSVPSPHILMGITFGGFHLIYAACTWPRASAKPNA
jgi:hypothetical protein